MSEGLEQQHDGARWGDKSIHDAFYTSSFRSFSRVGLWSELMTVTRARRGMAESRSLWLVGPRKSAGTGAI